MEIIHVLYILLSEIEGIQEEALKDVLLNLYCLFIYKDCDFIIIDLIFYTLIVFRYFCHILSEICEKVLKLSLIRRIILKTQHAMADGLITPVGYT